MATAEEMERLLAALQNGERVEVDRHVGHSSPDFRIASENSRAAAEQNERGNHVVRIMGTDGRRRFECGADFEQTRDLLEAGAVFLPPASVRPPPR